MIIFIGILFLFGPSNLCRNLKTLPLGRETIFSHCFNWALFFSPPFFFFSSHFVSPPRDFSAAPPQLQSLTCDRPRSLPRPP